MSAAFTAGDPAVDGSSRFTVFTPARASTV
jgi:hypothetical protein